MAIQNIFNRVLRAGTRINLGGDAVYDLYYRLANGDLGRLGSVADRVIGYDATGALAQLTPAQMRALLALGTSALLNTGTTSGTIPVLGSGGKLDPTLLPALASHEFVQVANQAARLALTTAQVQPGDEAYQQDTLETFKLISTDPTQAGSWLRVSDVNITASDIVSGIIATARLGSGTLNNTTVLHGDGVFRVPVTDSLTWSTVSGTTQTMVSRSGYITNNASRVVCTLPATATAGDIIRIVGLGNGGWRVAQQAGQTIAFGDLATTVGAGGYIESTLARDTLEIVATSTSAWQVIGAVGNLDVV